MGDKYNKRYERKRGSKPAKGPKKRTITFSWIKFDSNQGQSTSNWEKEGLLSQLIERMRQIGMYETPQVLSNQIIKQYTKVGFPPESKFKKPQHVSPVYWAVIHITPNSKEVVVGYIEEDVFYIVFLDKEHDFWPSKSIQNKGKTKR